MKCTSGNRKRKVHPEHDKERLNQEPGLQGFNYDS